MRGRTHHLWIHAGLISFTLLAIYPVLWVLFWPMRAWMKKNRPDEYVESQRKK